MGRIVSSVLLLCLIYSTNGNSIPKINMPPFIHIREDIDIGAFAFRIDATDAEGDSLTYGIIGQNAVYFRVDKDNGNVFANAEFDKETVPDMEIEMTVSDSINLAKQKLIVVLVDANDNKPIFEESSYSEDVPENTTIGTTLFIVCATDADSGIVKYNIDEVSPSNGDSLFTIGDKNGRVQLIGNLSYSRSTVYRLKLNASDSGGEYKGKNVTWSSIAFAFITIVDVPDLDPQFLRLPYYASVEEDSDVGTSVFTVLAIDQDSGINDEIMFSIEDSKLSDLFIISTTTGVISVNKPIDREAIGNDLTLKIKATEVTLNIHGEEAFATADVQISIIDINDNKPEFYSCGDTCIKQTNFTGEIFEHSSGIIPINMTVKDNDMQGEILLTLAGPDGDVFSVTPAFTISESSVQLMVKNPDKLDFEEKEHMVVLVIATDKDDTSFQSTATVTVQLKDTNDNSPRFPHDNYKFSVPEHSDVGTTIATITAEDLDKLDEGKITYRLLPDSILKYFDVDPNTGRVYVRNNSTIDREVSSLYSVTLQARDSNNNTGTTVLEITLDDINDQPPVINRESYQVYVREDENVQLEIQATDADDPQTVNGQIVYGIVPSRYSNNFTINPGTGVLRNNGTLDLEAYDPILKGKIELNVTATDKGTPPKSTSVKVIINLADVNDNIPKFKEASYTFYVKEGDKGAFVGSVQAEDLDQTTDYNRISFSIFDGSFGNFMIRTFILDKGYMGNISVDQDIELDYEKPPNNFLLKVKASDMEDNTATVDVEVQVLDVNDERPEFKHTGPLTVMENSDSLEPVGRFLAEDKDGNHSLVFVLESEKCLCSSNINPCKWFLLDPSGAITVNTEEHLDYELCQQVTMTARVEDQYTEKGENNSVTSGEMVINVKDVNDNTPEFIMTDSVFVVVSESASKGTSVASVTATDSDSELNKQIEFKVTSVHFTDITNHTNSMRTIFEVITTQQKDIYVGIIQSVEELDTGLRGKYLVTVEAKDNGGLSTTTVLEIFTVDKSFKIKLRFEPTQEEVEESLSSIIRALTSATKASVEIVSIKPYTEETRARGGTLIEAYFVYPNGTALDSVSVEKMLSSPEHFLVLSQLGLADIGTFEPEGQPPDMVQFVLLGIVGALIIVMSVLTISLVCTRRNYRTKLKAAKAMNSAAMAVTENQKSSAVVPGTNKYTMEGANPVLNLIIDTTTDLGFSEESSNADRASLNSLDDNVGMSEKDSMNLTIIQEEDEESGYIEPLGAALAQRGLKTRSNNPQMGHDNPMFSTTDL